MLDSQDRDNIYFAAKPAKDCADVLTTRAEEWNNLIANNGYLDKLRSCYSAFHGCFYNQDGFGGNQHSISFSGEQGELVNLPVNNWANIAQHMVIMVTANRPAMDCRATNTDYKSLVQTYLANNILDYYVRDKKIEKYLKTAVEYAVVYGAGFVTMEWDATRGEMVDYDEDTKTKIYEGDIVFGNLSPFDVMVDGTKENNAEQEWVLIRKWKNKFDLAAKYPELADKLTKIPAKGDVSSYRLGFNLVNQTTDDVQVLEFYHKRTDALPDGRYMMFCSSEIVMQDLPIPYRTLPVFRIAPRDIHGTPYGYTSMFDLLPLQEGLNSLYSTVMTNQSAFGVQNVANPRGNDVTVTQVIGGLNFIDYNVIPGAPNGGQPVPLNLTQTPTEVFKFIEILQQQMETISGINSVARGNPEASLKSGTALALVQSMALQFMSGLQESYVELIENVGTALIKMLQDFAHTPRVIAIAGVSNRSEMKQFNSADISNISRVVVDVGNPMSRTTAGKVQMAEQLLQYGEITPEQYVTLINTGNLNTFTEGTVHEELLMKGENEALVNGDVPTAVFTENHKGHIDFHRSVLFDPELKKDVELVKRTQNHIQQHINLLRTTDPALLNLMGQTPLPPLPQPGQPPQGGPPPGAPMPPMMGSPGPGGHPPAHHNAPPHPSGLPPGVQPPVGHGPAPMMMPNQGGQQGPGILGGRVQGPGLPINGQKLPNLPQVNPQLLPNPVLQQQQLNNLKR